MHLSFILCCEIKKKIVAHYLSFGFSGFLFQNGDNNYQKDCHKVWMMSTKAEYSSWHMVGAELMLVPTPLFYCHWWSIKKYELSGRKSNYFYFYLALVWIGSFKRQTKENFMFHFFIFSVETPWWNFQLWKVRHLLGNLKKYWFLDSTHRDSDLFGLWYGLGIRIF